MKKYFNIILMATALTLGWGCSSSDDDDAGGNKPAVPTVEPPQWKVEFSLPQGQSGAPDWESKLVDFFQFENTMTAVLRLEDEMTPFLSEDDQMAAVINDEVREVGYIQHYTYADGETFSQFMLLIPFAEQEKTADLFYYNAKTKQSYKMTTISLIANSTLGSESDFVVGLFTLGEIAAKLPSNAPFTYKEGDELGLFVGDVCCGVATYDAANQQWTMTAYRASQDSTKAHFRYYSAEKKAIYKTTEVIDFITLPRAVVTPYPLEFQ